jgi:hypothetical protein
MFLPVFTILSASTLAKVKRFPGSISNAARAIARPGAAPPFLHNSSVYQRLTIEQLPVFIMLDQCVAGDDGSAPQPEILRTRSVDMSSGKPVITAAIDSFPFPYYLIVTDLTQLPQRLADALRQWFEAGRSA